MFDNTSLGAHSSNNVIGCSHLFFPFLRLFSYRMLKTLFVCGFQLVSLPCLLQPFAACYCFCPLAAVFLLPLRGAVCLRLVRGLPGALLFY